jgi:hypothetical protein
MKFISSYIYIQSSPAHTHSHLLYHKEKKIESNFNSFPIRKERFILSDPLWLVMVYCCPMPFKLLGFSLGTPSFSTNKTRSHDITEILLKVVLKHHKP